MRTLYRPDDLGVSQNDPLTLLPLGIVQPLALPGESYKMAFTPGLARQIFVDSGKLLQVDLDSVLANEGKYVHSEGDNNWWIPSGRMFYSPVADNDASTERAYARRHFFLPHRYRDPFHTKAVSTESFVTYDGYDLLMLETRDALGNCVTVGERNVDPTQPLVRQGNDYRVLQPALMMDPNRNRSTVAFDALGMVAGTAVMGKPEDNPVPGDLLAATFHSDLTQAEIDQFFANPKGPTVATLLDSATTRIIYDLTGYWREPDPQKKPPAFAVTLARETHTSDPVPAGGLKIQVSFSYSDGFGRVIQKKIQAEPGPVPKRDANGKIIVGANGQPEMTATNVSPRWVGSGWTVFNNKGKPVRQYEPFFTDTHRFEFDVKIGVSPVLFYDPVERVIATLHPNHTYEKVIFDPWEQVTWDVNDTLKVPDNPGDPAFDPKNDPDVGHYFERVANDEYLPTWYDTRTDAAKALQAWPDTDTQGQPIPDNARRRTTEKSAAEKAAIHAGTPTAAHFDSLGRAFLTVAHNKFKRSDTPPAAPPTEEFYRTRVLYDIEGNQREVMDARDRVVMRYDYDMLSNRLHQASMEAGERWMLNDVAGKPLYAWDSRSHTFRTEYDPLRRPLRIYVTGADSANPNQELLTERMVYGEQHPEELRNLRGQLYLQLDQAGVVFNELYNFKGNLQRATRCLTNGTQYKQAVDWRAVDANHVALPPDATTKLDPSALEAAFASRLEVHTYTSHTRYDALNRPTQLIAPHSNQLGATVNITQHAYNEAGLLERLDVWLNQPTEPAGLLDATTVPPSPVGVNNIDYDAKGQRLRIDYKNAATTQFAYDPETFRLIHLYTRRGATFTEDCENPQPPPPTIAAPDVPPPGKPCGLQNLHYTYDPVGNITQIRDDAQDRVYHSNTCVLPGAEYCYDALYRLLAASGREHKGDGQQYDWDDSSHVVTSLPNDCQSLQNYVETYRYDSVGNIMQMVHQEGRNLEHPGQVMWNRRYQYALDSNRLLATSLPGDPANLPDYVATPGYSAKYTYDPHGNITAMPHLPQMSWDFKDQLSATTGMVKNDNPPPDKVPATTYYVYDAAGQRVRKVTELSMGHVKDERIYLGGFEIYRKNGANPLVRETLHIMDDKQRIALVETRTQGNDPAPQQLIRYQFGNHLGSASLELDDQAKIISYEEYTPYGSTAYQAVRSQTETARRYRYTGKERDEESGLYYYVARYYISWLGRWTSCDPGGLIDATNFYEYAKDNPAKYMDPDGRRPATKDEAAALQRLQQVESDARERYSKLSTVRKVWSHLVGGPQIEAGRAKYNREAYAAAINRAVEGEGIAITPGLVRGVFTFMTDREAARERQLEVLQAITNSVLASATYTTADIAGTRPEVKEGLTLAASALSDIAFVAAQTKTHRDVNSGWGNYQFGRQTEMERGALLEPIRATPGSGSPEVIKVDPNTLRFSQTSAGGRGGVKADSIRESLRIWGWQGGPIDVVSTDKGLVTIDNTRAALAQDVELPEIPVRVHSSTELLPESQAGRFGSARTWGEALQYRTSGQDKPLPPEGTTTRPRIQTGRLVVSPF